MAAYLLDTNILLRITDDQSPEHGQAVHGVSTLLDRGSECYVTPQILLEYFSVLSRPGSVNGFGWTPARALDELDSLLDRFPLLDDTPEVFTQWRKLVDTYPAGGRRIFDYRLAAVAIVHGAEHILTYDIQDFPEIPGLAIVHPGKVVLG